MSNNKENAAQAEKALIRANLLLLVTFIAFLILTGVEVRALCETYNELAKYHALLQSM